MQWPQHYIDVHILEEDIHGELAILVCVRFVLGTHDFELGHRSRAHRCSKGEEDSEILD